MVDEIDNVEAAEECAVKYLEPGHFSKRPTVGVDPAGFIHRMDYWNVFQCDKVEIGQAHCCTCGAYFRDGYRGVTESYQALVEHCEMSAAGEVHEVFSRDQVVGKVKAAAT